MLKEVVFHLSPKTTNTQAVRTLLNELNRAGIGTSTNADAFALPPENCLVLTDSSSGIASARASAVPCIGYAPPEGSEDLSDAYALFEDFASLDITYLCRTHAHAIGYPAHILTTKRLIVREFSETDFPTLYAMCTEPSTSSFMEEVLADYNTEQEKHLAYLRNIYPFFDLALWGVYEKDSGKLIGRAGFSLPDDDSDTFSLGYLIDVPYRKRGYAKELIPALLSYAKDQGYTEVSARIKKENTVSVKVLEQCGFPYECREYFTEGIVSYHIHLTV